MGVAAVALLHPALVRVAVTGATGNVGTATVEALAARPEVDEVLGIARRRPFLDVDKVRWIGADVGTDPLRRLFAGCDVVVHLAWLIQPSRDEARLEAVNVHGSRRVFEAAGQAGVGTLVHASSVGAYSAGPKDRAVDESWPTGGIATSTYSRQKAAVERILDGIERRFPALRVARLRPGFVLQRRASTELRRYFLGPFLPGALVRRRLVPVVPRMTGLRFQAVHAADVGEAFASAAVYGVEGAFNVAADPVLDGAELGRIIGARPVPLPAGPVRAALDLTWRMRLHPTDPGWLDLVRSVPVMDTARARTELRWTPRHTAGDAVIDVLDGIGDGAGWGTPPLQGAAGVADRVRELRTGVGGREQLG